MARTGLVVAGFGSAAVVELATEAAAARSRCAAAAAPRWAAGLQGRWVQVLVRLVPDGVAAWQQQVVRSLGSAARTGCCQPEAQLPEKAMRQQAVGETGRLARRGTLV